MRGAVTVALALTTTATEGIPEPVRHLVASTAIGYVIASLIINGLSLRPLMNRLKLDKFNDLDLVLRSRIVNLARRRIRKELHEVAAAGGHDAEELSRSVIPNSRLRIYRTRTTVDLSVALDTWCHHELDTVLMFRERGLITRHQADALRHHTDRLLNALRDDGAESYEAEVQRLRRVGPLLRIAFWLHRRFGWRRTLRSAISGRMEYLVAEQLLIRELMQQCDANAETLFGKDVAPSLHTILSRRAAATEKEIDAIEHVYPKFAHAMRQRYLTLVALGLVEAEYRRHLAEATISADVFEDLDAHRRAIAARFTRRQHHELELDSVSVAEAFPLATEYPALRSGLRAYVAFPGQKIEITRRRRRYALFVVFGQVEAIGSNGIVTLKPGDFFGQKAFFGQCTGVSSAISLGYTNMLEVDMRLLKSQMRSNPALKERLSPRMSRQHTLATAS
jgi:CPA1 family monovalent cation:H+ antiporter